MTLLVLKQVQRLSTLICCYPQIISLGRSNKNPVVSTTRMGGEEEWAAKMMIEKEVCLGGGEWDKFKWKITILGRHWQDSQISLCVNGIWFNYISSLWWAPAVLSACHVTDLLSATFNPHILRVGDNTYWYPVCNDCCHSDIKSHKIESAQGTISCEPGAGRSQGMRGKTP